MNANDVESSVRHQSLNRTFLLALHKILRNLALLQLAIAFGPMRYDSYLFLFSAEKYKNTEPESFAKRLSKLNMHTVKKKSNRLKYRFTSQFGLVQLVCTAFFFLFWYGSVWKPSWNTSLCSEFAFYTTSNGQLWQGWFDKNLSSYVIIIIVIRSATRNLTNWSKS